MPPKFMTEPLAHGDRMGAENPMQRGFDAHIQLTVNGSPLYTWQGDKAAGDATGQDVNGFYVVMATGSKYDPGASISS
jgi:predicted lipoprotein with Yx(FWY)xxD motif